MQPRFHVIGKTFRYLLLPDINSKPEIESALFDLFRYISSSVLIVTCCGIRFNCNLSLWDQKNTIPYYAIIKPPRKITTRENLTPCGLYHWKVIYHRMKSIFWGQYVHISHSLSSLQGGSRNCIASITNASSFFFY